MYPQEPLQVESSAVRRRLLGTRRFQPNRHYQECSEGTDSRDHQVATWRRGCRRLLQGLREFRLQSEEPDQDSEEAELFQVHGELTTCT